MRRTPWATPVSSVMVKNAMSPVRLTWVPPQNSLDSPMVSTRTVSPYFSPKKAIAPAFLASAIASTSVSAGRLARTRALTRSSTRWRSSGVSGAKCEKSKRRRSGATSEPFCVTCAPSTVRSAQCSRCVAEWLRRMASRRSPSTSSSTASPTRSSPSVTSPRCTYSVDTGRFTSSTRSLALADADRAGVAHLAALLAVERRLGGDDRDPLRVRADRVDLLAVGDQRHDLRRAARAPRSRGTAWRRRARRPS